MTTPRALTPEDVARPHPVFVVWELTLRCDQACRHCGSRAGAARREELSTEEALRVVGELADAGVREVGLIGGEAYLRDDWLEIARAITAHGMRCALVTGGRALDATKARALRDAGFYSVSVSVDGLGPTHDALRSVPGSFDAALQAIDAVRSAGVVATVNTQINRPNRHELEALGDLLVARGVRAWQLQITTPMGRAADQAALVLQPWHLLDLFPRLAALRARHRKRCTIIAANNLGYFGPHEGDLRAGGWWTGCPGGRYSLGIQSDGTVKGCASLPTRTWGDRSLKDHSLSEILAGSPALIRLRERSVAGLTGFCATCYYREECLGGCVWTATTFLGDWGQDPYCHHRALELRARGRRERVVPKATAPGEAFDHGLWEIVEEDWDESTGA